MAIKSAGTQLLDPRDIRQSLDLSRERIGSLLHVSAKTYERWEKGEASPSEQHRGSLLQLKEIETFGLLVYTPDGLREFLRTPMTVFDGHSALDMITLGQHDRVIAALAADYEGLGY
jgi:transcriptional regulator with XRE-family HTH domain